MSTSKLRSSNEIRTVKTDKEQFEVIDDGLLVRAPGKINLSLHIAGKRPDGFHEIETIMAKVNFYDEILIQQGQKAGIELICNGPEWAPAREDNLVYKAAEMLLKSYRQGVDFKITLTKNIPAGTGLGSASSDAAATLIGLNKYLNLQIPYAELAKLATQLGSDVAFFLDGPLAFCTGKGEKIKKLNENFNFLTLLILPDVSVSTKKVYANYKHDKEFYERLHKEITEYIEKNRIDLVCGMCANMLQESSFDLHKELRECKDRIESFGIRPVCLSGSGSSMFCIIDDRNEEGVRTYRDNLIQDFGWRSIIVNNNSW